MNKYLFTFVVVFISIWCILITTGCAGVSTKSASLMIIQAYKIGVQDGKQEVLELIQKLTEQQAEEQEIEDSIGNPKIKI